MNSININSKNFKVTNYNSEIRPFEFIVQVEDISKIIKNVTTQNKIQKTDIFGNKLYRIKSNDKYVEVTNENPNYINGDPVFIFNKENKNVKLIDYPTSFSLEDVLEYKKQELLSKQNDFKNCLLYETNIEKLVDTSYEDTNADTGFKMINIHSNGKVKLHFNIDYKNVTKIKLNFENLDVKVSVNGKDYEIYDGESVQSSNDITTLDIILFNNLDYDIKLENIYLFTN